MRAILLVSVGLLLPWQNLYARHDPYDKGGTWLTNTQLLPQYCQDRAKGSHSAEWNKWRNTFGEAYIHIHHYCDGIYAEQKARLTIDARTRNVWLGSVIHEMQYVGSHCSAGCVLYPELHTRWAWALSEQNQSSEAIRHYQLAIKAQPKYTLAYARLADLYVKLDQPGEAHQVLESGLKVKPGSRMLQKRLEKLEPSPEGQ